MNPTVVKVVSIAAGVVLFALAALVPNLDMAVRLGLMGAGGFLIGFPIKAPGTPAALLLLLALSPALPACSSSLPTVPETPEAAEQLGSDAADTLRAAHAAACASVQVLADATTFWANAVPEGDQERAATVLPAVKKIRGVLELATAALERAKPYVDNGTNEAEVRKQLRDALGYADAALGLLDMAGQEVPAPAKRSLAFLRGLLGRSDVAVSR